VPAAGPPPPWQAAVTVQVNTQAPGTGKGRRCDHCTTHPRGCVCEGPTPSRIHLPQFPRYEYVKAARGQGRRRWALPHELLRHFAPCPLVWCEPRQMMCHQLVVKLTGWSVWQRHLLADLPRLVTALETALRPAKVPRSRAP
jgi:hypothetical protein